METAEVPVIESEPVNPDAGFALIVNYLPPSYTDYDLHQLFSDVGPLFSAKVMRNKHTQSSFGYGFVNFVKEEDAERAIDEKDGEKVLHKRIRVAFSRRAEGPDSIKNANLFVGNLPLSWKEGDLERAFTPHGKVIKCKVLIDQLTGISRGSGFVLFSKNAEAENALKEIDGQKLPGCEKPLSVKRNNPQEDSKTRAFPPKSASTTTSKEIHVIHSYPHHPISYPNQNFYSAIPHLPRPPYYNSGAPAFYEYSSAHTVPSFGTPIPLNIPGQLGLFQARPPLGRPGQESFSPQRSSSGPASSNQGFSLFVRNLGSRCTELDLYQLFGPHGAISKAHVQLDATGKAKGFGFVTYNARQDAERAIETLNGFAWEKNNHRPLQVSFKTEK